MAQRPSIVMFLNRMLIGIIADRETTFGFLLAGIGESNPQGTNKNFLLVSEETTNSEIAQFFNNLYKRRDICVIFIGCDIASRIAHVLRNATKTMPVVLEIPTKESIKCRCTDAH